MRDIPGIQSQSTTPKFEPLFWGCAKTRVEAAQHHHGMARHPPSALVLWPCFTQEIEQPIAWRD